MSNFEQALERTDGKTLILSNGSKWQAKTRTAFRLYWMSWVTTFLTRCLSSITVIAHTRLNQW